MVIDNEFGTTIKVISNDRAYTRLYYLDDGSVYDSDDTYICNMNDEDYEDKITEYENNWYENNLSSRDYSNMLNCNEDDVDDCMGNYFRK